MTSPQYNDGPPLSRTRQVILVVATAIIILGLIGLVLRAVSPPAPQTPATIAAGGTYEWPTPRPGPPPTTTSTPRPTPLPTPTETPMPTATPIVIGGFQELGNFISVEYTLQTVVEAERERIFPLSPERIILVAVGNVQAGIDLTQIQDEDIIIEGTSVKLTLPPAAVTSVELLPGESEVYDSQRGWLLSEYEGLELEAMDKARTQLEGWAVNRVNVLAEAEEQAKLQLEPFLRQLGFEEIEITFKR